MKRANRKLIPMNCYFHIMDGERQWPIYLLFAVIGMLAVVSGMFFAENSLGLAGQSVLWVIVLVFVALFGGASVLVRNRLESAKALAFVFVIAFVVLSVTFGGIFAWSAHSWATTKSIHVDELSERPKEYQTLSASVLEHHPALRRAITCTSGCERFDETSWFVNIGPEEWRRTQKFLRSNYVEYRGKYYRLSFVTA